MKLYIRNHINHLKIIPKQRVKAWVAVAPGASEAPEDGAMLSETLLQPDILLIYH